VNLFSFLSAVRRHPRLKYWLAGAAILLVGLSLATRHPAHVYRFFGVWGPLRASVVEPARKAQISDYSTGSEHRLAILVTDPDSDWLGLVRGLKAHGVPFVMTENPDVALRHKTIFIYPIISGRVLQARHFRALVDHVHAGGSLLTFDFEGAVCRSCLALQGRQSLALRRPFAGSQVPTRPDWKPRVSVELAPKPRFRS